MPKFNRRTVAVLASFALLCTLDAASAWACPTCKEGMSHDPATAGLVRGYAISICFMISMPFVIFTALSSYFYWEICRARKSAEAANAKGGEMVAAPELKLE